MINEVIFYIDDASPAGNVDAVVDSIIKLVKSFTKKKDESAEAAVESALKGKGLSWYKQTDFLNDEKLFQTTYEMEVIIHG